MPNYESMTLEQLERENQRLMAKRGAIQAEQLEINRILSERRDKAEAKKKFNTMSDAEKDELKQLISGAGGIESEEKVEAPGTE